MNEILTQREVDALVDCERTIRSGLRTFRDVGHALLKIRSDRLYRSQFATFEDYCQTQWSMDRRNANRTIEAATMAETLGSIDPNFIPGSIGQARELSGLEPEVAAEVMRNANDNGKVTAQTIREARKVIAPKPVAKVTESTKTETYVDTDTGEVVASDFDTKTYSPNPRRKPMTEAFQKATYDLGKTSTTLVNLVTDDRYQRNASQIAEQNLGDLTRIIDALQRVIDQLTHSDRSLPHE